MNKTINEKPTPAKLKELALKNREFLVEKVLNGLDDELWQAAKKGEMNISITLEQNTLKLIVMDLLKEQGYDVIDIIDGLKISWEDAELESD